MGYTPCHEKAGCGEGLHGPAGFVRLGGSGVSRCSRDVSRVKSRKVVSGSIDMRHQGLRRVDASAVDGPHRTLTSRFRHWWEEGVFRLPFSEIGLIRRHGCRRGADERWPTFPMGSLLP